MTYSQNKLVYFDKSAFYVTENVYEPAEDSFLFAENLKIRPNDDVLDMGTGCGILAVLAAKLAKSVVAIDVNPYAVVCAKKNAERNRISKKTNFVQADMFQPLHQDTAFDLILFNAPYLPSEKYELTSWISRSWAGGSKGREIVDRFINEAPKYLKGNGKILLMQSTLTDVPLTLKQFIRQGFEAIVKAEQKLPFFETITLIEAKHQQLH